MKDLTLSTLLFLLAAPCAATEAHRLWGGSIAVGSEYVFRGISQTMGSPSLQASIDLDLESGVYAYAWASNVDFVAAGDADDGATYEVDLAIGYAAELGDAWRIDVALVRYLFPGTVAGVDYDYNELITTVDFAGNYSATVAYSRNADGTGAPSLFYELGARFELAQATNVTLNFGYVDVSEAYGAAYSYGQATLARSFGPTTLVLTYLDTQDSAASIYGDRITGQRFVLTLELGW